MDLILLAILGGFMLLGLYLGLVHTFGALIGIVFGAFVAGNFYRLIGGWIEPMFGAYANIAYVIVFILIFIIVNRLIGLIFHLLFRVYKIISFVPFVKTFNRLGGFILGALEGVFVLGVILFIASRYSLGATIDQALMESDIAYFFVKASKIFTFLMPDAVQHLQPFF